MDAVARRAAPRTPVEPRNRPRCTARAGRRCQGTTAAAAPCAARRALPLVLAEPGQRAQAGCGAAASPWRHLAACLAVCRRSAAPHVPMCPRQRAPAGRQGSGGAEGAHLAMRRALHVAAGPERDGALDVHRPVREQHEQHVRGRDEAEHQVGLPQPLPARQAQRLLCATAHYVAFPSTDLPHTSNTELADVLKHNALQHRLAPSHSQRHK